MKASAGCAYHKLNLVDYIFHLHIPSPHVCRLQLGVCEFWASEDYFFHHSEQLQLVSTVCPNIRKMLFMFRWDIWQTLICLWDQFWFLFTQQHRSCISRPAGFQLPPGGNLKTNFLENSLWLAGVGPVGWRLLCRRTLPNLHPDRTPAHKAQSGEITWNVNLIFYIRTPAHKAQFGEIT